MEKRIVKIGVIGLGGRTDGFLKWGFAEVCEDFEVIAVTDIDQEQVKEKIKDSPRVYRRDARIYADADEMLEKEELDGVFIGTRQNLHAQMALKVIKKGIPLFLEKPVCITMDEVNALNEVRKMYQPKVMVSFPLRTSLMTQKVKEIVDSGQIGELQNVQAYNDIPYGRCYFRGWMRDPKVSGGLWLEKATHDLDVINYIVGQKAVKLCAMDSVQIFKGDMPEELTCAECEKRKNCPESDYTIEKVYGDEAHGGYCCFTNSGNREESASVIIRYESGLHASYSQNCIARFKAGRRGARFYGYKGTVELDFTNFEVRVMRHDFDRVDTYKFHGITDPHAGGDQCLSRNFMDMMLGGNQKSTLLEGLQSACLGIMARESCEKDLFVEVPDIDC